MLAQHADLSLVLAVPEVALLVDLGDEKDHAAVGSNVLAQDELVHLQDFAIVVELVGGLQDCEEGGGAFDELERGVERVEAVEEAETLRVVVAFIEAFQNVSVGERDRIRSSVELIEVWTGISIAMVGQQSMTVKA